MSVAQIQKIFRGALPTQPVEKGLRPKKLYFDYGSHLCFMEFQAKYPSSEVVGIGYLEGWTWHINALGTQSTTPTNGSQANMLIQDKQMYDPVR